MTQKDEVEKVHGNGTHLLILGAGASIASTLKNPELSGKELPSMNNIIDIVGLNDIISNLPNSLQVLRGDFEKLYSNLFINGLYLKEKSEIEKRIYNYFKELRLPETPTIYDYMILSLRHHKDVIATFNWDPFLYQAFNRNSKFIKPLGILHLHGNVALGFCKSDGTIGPSGGILKTNYNYFEPTRLLYPIEEKNYNSDEFIRGQWEALQNELQKAKRVTIFGYRAPKSDIGAISIMEKAWGGADKRVMEQFELIDIREENEVKKSWNNFIHETHYDYHTNFFKSSIAQHPRRSIESYHHWSTPFTPDEMFQDGNPVPTNFKTLREMWTWYDPLINAEDKFYNSK